MRFQSLDQSLKAKRPAARWKAPMIENQQIRWFRTTLLVARPAGHRPPRPVGPWRDVWLERRRHFEIADLRIRASRRGPAGVVELTATLDPLGPDCRRAARGRTRRQRIRSGTRFRSAPTAPAAACASSRRRSGGRTRMGPALYDARIEVDTKAQVGRRVSTVRLAPSASVRCRWTEQGWLRAARERRAHLLPRRLLDAARRGVAERSRDRLRAESSGKYGMRA
jgi:hypothetical protein